MFARFEVTGSFTDRGTEVLAAAPPTPEDLLDGMTAAPIEETNFIRITYHALDGRTAIDAVNSLASSYMVHRREIKSNKQTAEFFEELIEQARSKVDRMRAEIAIYKSEHGITDISAPSETTLRVSPMTLLDSQQLRLKRMYPSAGYRATTSTVQVPIPRSGSGVGAPRIRDLELLQMVADLILALNGKPQGSLDISVRK